MEKILCIIPPYIPSYFNAGHHLPLFLLSSYLKEKIPNAIIKAVDAAALNYTWKDMCSLLSTEYNFIALMDDFDAVDTFERFMYYKNKLCPNAKVVTFGRLSKQIPRFFFRFNVDAVVCNGDYEAGILNYIHWITKKTNRLRGVLIDKNDEFTLGEYLSAEDWVLPNINEIPYENYSYMYRNDLNKFCGIPARQELVVPLARGCPVGCSYCDVPWMQGKKERRLTVDRTISYIVNAFRKIPFEYVSFYAPTFTLKKQWVLDLCESLIHLDKIYPWKCVTVLKLLDETLLKKMAESGCVRISLGIETFSESAADSLPKCKRSMREKFLQIAKMCMKYGIELNCFVMLGLPDDTPQQVFATAEFCRKLGARIRPTLYTPYNLMKDTMSVMEVSQFNRQLFVPDTISTDSETLYYKYFHSNENDKATVVMNNIPKHELKINATE